MKIKISGTPEEFAALAAALQERRGTNAGVLVREPYSRAYEIRSADGRESSREAK